MIYRASPHLRHILAVLPFLMIAMASMFFALLSNKKPKFLKPVLIGIVVFAFSYTVLFSLALIRRMTHIDTRIECAEWMKNRITKEITIGLASYFPWNYTPPIDMLTKSIVLTGYNYDNLMAQRPNYFIISEYEYREFSHARESSFMCKNFVRKLFSEEHYEVIKIFGKGFKILGIEFHPRFPNMDWNPVNPRIYILESRSH
jgi:hypothetical protein